MSSVNGEVWVLLSGKTNAKFVSSPQCTNNTSAEKGEEWHSYNTEFPDLYSQLQLENGWGRQRRPALTILPPAFEVQEEL